MRVMSRRGGLISLVLVEETYLRRSMPLVFLETQFQAVYRELKSSATILAVQVLKISFKSLVGTLL